MTFLEKAIEIDKIRGKKQTRTEILDTLCPSDYGFEIVNDDCDGECEDCCNREMPDTEAKEDEPLKDFTDDLLNTGYNKGASDVWEFIKKWCDMTHIECVDAFGNSSLRLTLDRYSPSEALAKLKAYEEAQSKIEVGDVIKTPIGNAVVTKVSDDEYIGIVSSGEYVRVGGFVAKTGKHINLDSVLEQIGE